MFLSNIQVGRNLLRMTSIHINQLESHSQMLRESKLTKRRCIQPLANNHHKLMLELRSKNFKIPMGSVILTKNAANKISETPF